MTPTSPYALLFGSDEMLNLTRSWILERAGFTVQRTKGMKEAAQLAKIQHVDLLVLCYSTTEEECLKILAKAESDWAGVTKLWVGRHDKPTPMYLPQDVTAIVEGPHELYLAAVQALRQIAAFK